MSRFFKDALIVGFALFAMFFGAGNIIFPPYVGLIAGKEWLTGFFWYYMADIGLALIAIIGMLRARRIDQIEGIMYRLGKIPARIMISIILICIGPLIAIPRTAVVGYEMLIKANSFDISILAFVVVYFLIAFSLSIRESSLVDIVGKVLTPLLVLGLTTMIVIGIITPIGPLSPEARTDSLIFDSVISGYQTLDVFAALIYGLLIANAMKLRGYTTVSQRTRSVFAASCVAGILLFFIYGGLCYLGATVSDIYPKDTDRALLVINIANHLLGHTGALLLGIVVLLACLTTAIALIGSMGAFFSRITNNRLRYRQLVVATTLFSVVISNVGLDSLIEIATPILMTVYPGALVIVVLSLFNAQIKNDNIFRFATYAAMLASLSDVLLKMGLPLESISLLPWQAYGFGWIMPAVVAGVIGKFIPSASPSVPGLSAPKNSRRD